MYVTDWSDRGRDDPYICADDFNVSSVSLNSKLYYFVTDQSVSMI